MLCWCRGLSVFLVAGLLVAAGGCADAVPSPTATPASSREGTITIKSVQIIAGHRVTFAGQSTLPDQYSGSIWPGRSRPENEPWSGDGSHLFLPSPCKGGQPCLQLVNEVLKTSIGFANSV